MYNYSIDNFLEFFGGLSILIIFLGFVFVIFAVIVYVFGSLGIMEVAKKNNIANPWLAFIPVANSYLLGKLGFEVYSNDEEKNTTFPWIMLGLAAFNFIASGESSLSSLASLALSVFATISYYRIYKYLTKKYVMYTVLSFFFGGIPLFINKSMIKPKEENNINETKIVQEDISKENFSRPLYCSNCGNKLESHIKFCGNCGKEIG